jgi:hypothetical protein
LEEVLGVIVEKVEAVFRGYEQQRIRDAAWEREREEQAKRREEEEAREAKRQEREEAKRKERERLHRHERKLEELAAGRRSNLNRAAENWIEGMRIMIFLDACEDRWRTLAGGELTQAQAEWLAWARREAEGQFPFAVGYPDPSLDGAFDASAVPVGGPYPDVREFEDTPAEKAPEVKSAVPQAPPLPPSPPQQFPFWLLHRRRW